MQIRGLAVLLVIVFTLPAFAEKRAMPDGHVVHTRRAPVAMHRMSPPYRGNHVYEKPPAEPKQARSERDERNASRRDRQSPSR